ncbi:peptidylprolyl isomerase [Marinivivus vitaminiproducens]|uniref:peptidylprolyl isomerase n=1 Tax=Marinivivus vitaminiproducens TaxID=3035935 RepID=UPI0027A3940A|nr:peptidylprolyl isomerase [Geminicoccaceae bacterium SCSIO 64248]
MIRSTIVAFAFGLSAVILAQPAQAQEQPAQAQEEGGDPVVARVNGVEVHRSEVDAAAAELPEQFRQMPPQALYTPLLERVIDTKLLAARAEDEKLGDDPAVKRDLDRARASVLRDSLVVRTIEQEVSDDDLRARYDEMSAQPDFAYDEVNVRHILVGSEDEAKQVIADLDNGGDFATLANERSTDPSAKTNGGELGWIKQDAVVPEFGAAAFAMEKGQRSEAPVQTQFGWHVIEVTDKRQTTPSFEEIEPQLRQEAAREVLTAMMEDLRSGAEIERFNADGSPMPPPDAAPAGGEAAPAEGQPAPAPAQ